MTDTTDIKALRDQPDHGPYVLVMAQNEALTKGIVVLQSQLEAERQRADKANRTCSDLLRTATDEAMRANKAEAELAALKGEQVPVAWTSQRSLETKNKIVAFTDDMSALDYGVANGWTDIVELFTAPQKPVVLLPPAYEKSADLTEYHQGWNACRNYMLAEAKEAGDIVKDGE